MVSTVRPVHGTDSRRSPLVTGAVALAVAGLAFTGLLSPASPAAADEAVTVADITPPLQEASNDGIAIDLTGPVTIVASADVDAPALAALEDVVSAAGGTATVSPSAPGDGTTVYLGTDDAATALAAVDGPSIADLPAEGYVLASGTVSGAPTLVLAGADGTGAYYAVQTLRQLVSDGVASPARIRDFPLMPIRGTIEGFYGTPWSHEARMDLLDYSGSHKLNTYIYTPKDDLLLRLRWKELYEGAQLDRIAELVQEANDHHVQFTFALSPGDSICYSSDEDFEATTKKFDQLRELGVESFYIALDDIQLTFHCDADSEKYPNTGNWHWLAEAQADYLNRVQTEYIEPNGLNDLQIVPTNYAGSAEDPYKGKLGDVLTDDIRVQWTGEGVFSDTVTVESVQQASTTYRTEHLYIWDNFPVNDGARDRLFLNPLTGRDADLYEYIDGFTSNPMIEPYASWPALANYADYTWNGPDYDAEASMATALEELAGPDARVQETLTAFADLNQSWPYRDEVVYAPALGADIEAYRDGDGDEALRDRLALLQAAPEVLADMAVPGFYSDSQPWIDAAAQWATSFEHELDLLEALGEDNGVAAAAAFVAAFDLVQHVTTTPTVDDTDGEGVLHEDVIVPRVGDGRFDEFFAATAGELEEWLGVEPNPSIGGYPGTGTTSMGTYQDNAIENMTDGDPETLYWSNQTPAAGDEVGVDLGQEREIGSVRIQQADNDTDTAGDMITDATLQYSVDGETWTDAGTFTDSPLIVTEFNEPVTARYVRLVANSEGSSWVKIREFQVLADADQFTSTLPSVEGAGVSLAFDGSVLTAFRAESAPQEDAAITYRFPEPVTVGSVSVLGSGVGDIEVDVDGEWVTIGQLTDDRYFHEGELAPAGEATAVRLSFEAGSPAPVIYEVVSREGGPIGVEPTEPPTEEPPTEEPPTEGPTTGEPTDGSTEDPTGGADVPSDGSEDPGSSMPDTGAAVGPLMLTAAGLLAAGGAALALTLRRRRAS